MYLLLHYLTRPFRLPRNRCGIGDRCYLCHAATHEVAPKLWPAYILAAWVMFNLAILLSK